MAFYELHLLFFKFLSKYFVQLWLFQAYNRGLRRMVLSQVLTEICVPIISTLGLILAMPYIISRSLVPLLGSSKTSHLPFESLHTY